MNGVGASEHESASPQLAASPGDPIVISVIQNECEAAVDEMRSAVQRTARSPTVQIGDFAATLLDAKGSLAGFGVPHVQFPMFQELGRRVLELYRDDLAEGDVFVCNDPYGGGSHLPDVTVLQPIFFERDLVAFAAVYTHHVDVGGRFSGSQSGKPGEIFEEGVRIPLVRLLRQGRLNAPLLATILANVRFADDFRGDVNAKIAGCRRANLAVLELFRRFGPLRVLTTFDHLQVTARNLTTKAISALPDGVYPSTAEVVDDGQGRLEPPELIRLAVRVEGSTITADFTGTCPQVAGAVNMPRANLAGLVYRTLHRLLCPDAPFNSGFTESIQIVAPEGSIVNPRFPAAVGGRAAVFFLVDEALYRCLSAAKPEAIPVPREQWDVVHYTVSQIDGSSSALLDLFCGGWGGGPDGDGYDGLGRFGFATPSAEVIERGNPLLIEGFGFVPDSEGAGQWRGSLAVTRRYRFLRPGTVMVRTNRMSQSDGFAGGSSGAQPRTRWFREGQELPVPNEAFVHLAVETGDVLEHRVGGAGGYGAPGRRSRGAVLRDVLEEKVSSVRAKVVYGVAVEDEEDQVARTTQ